VEAWFQVDELEVERLLSDWRWLCPSSATLLARNVFGELFLRDSTGAVLWLNTTTGKLSKVADSDEQFLQMAETLEKRREWFVEHQERTYAQLGLIPSSSQCIGFGVPAVFAEGGTPATAYLADIYEYVSFLGDLHRQIATAPDGSKVQLRVVRPKPASPNHT
jgi:hypothetical protein